jgi:hypothetical protein
MYRGSDERRPPGTTAALWPIHYLTEPPECPLHQLIHEHLYYRSGNERTKIHVSNWNSQD